MKVRLIIFVVFVLISNLVHSQVTQEWVKKYIGPWEKGATGLKVLTDNQNNIYVMGNCYVGIGNNYRDFALNKYNSSGVEQWVTVYNGPEDWVDDATDMIIDDSGNVFVTGYTATHEFTHYTTIKYNSSGQQQWIATYYSPPNAYLANNPTTIKLDKFGNVYVTGYSSTPSQYVDYLTVKYNSAGQQQWVARYEDGNYPHDLAVDDFGNVYVTGYSLLIGSTTYDIVTVKYNSAGQQQWVAQREAFSSMPDTRSCKIRIDNLGNVYVAGTAKTGLGGDDFLLIKYKPSGKVIWEKAFGGGYSDIFTDMELDLTGNPYLTGYYVQTPEYVCKTLKYDSSGVQRLELTYNGLGLEDYSSDIELDPFGNIYVTGNTEVPGSNNSYDFFTVKFNPIGTKLWDITYDGVADGKDHSNSLTLDNLNNVYITGVVFDSVPVMTTIKYSQTTGIQTLSNEIPAKFSLQQNYPNPFNPSTNIKFEIAKATNVKLVVYDALGREVKIVANETMQPGIYNANFDAENLSSGIYFYSLTTSEFTETKRMILLK